MFILIIHAFKKNDLNITHVRNLNYTKIKSNSPTRPRDRLFDAHVTETISVICDRKSYVTSIFFSVYCSISNTVAKSVYLIKNIRDEYIITQSDEIAKLNLCAQSDPNEIKK